MRFQVDLHTHTIASTHAYSTLSEYVEQAVDTGIAMFAMTDHGPGLSDAPHKWHFNNLSVIPRVIRGVAVLRGIEANIMEDGSLDIEDSIRGKLDIVLAALHSNYTPTNEKEHTRLLLKVIESGKVDVLSHPGARVYPIDYEEVLACAKEYNVAIEINGSTSVNARFGSHDNCVKIAKIAARLGNVISLGSDAHIASYLGCFDESIRVLEEAGLGYENVINTSPAKVLDFLESRGHSPIKELRELFTPFP